MALVVKSTQGLQRLSCESCPHRPRHRQRGRPRNIRLGHAGNQMRRQGVLPFTMRRQALSRVCSRRFLLTGQDEVPIFLTNANVHALGPQPSIDRVIEAVFLHQKLRGAVGSREQFLQSTVIRGGQCPFEFQFLMIEHGSGLWRIFRILAHRHEQPIRFP